jgi:predicted DNA-binding transcriptional regulator YafY
MAARNDDVTATLSRLLPREMEAVWLGALLTARFADAENAKAARRITKALEAIRATTIDGTVINLEAGAGSKVSPDTSLAHRVDIHALRQALVNELKLKIEYIDAKGRTTKRVVWPLDVQDFGPNGAILAWCEKRGDFRNFRFDRIGELRIIQKRFDTPRTVMLAFYEALQVSRDGDGDQW